MNRILGRKKSDREHMLRNLATSLVLFEKIDTTEAKAKEVKSFLDQIIARHKTNDFNTIRSLKTIFFDSNAVDKIVKELIPRYENRKSGFIKSFRMGNRLGDNSPMIRLELVDHKVFVTKETKPENITKENKDSQKTESSDVKVSSRKK